MSSFELADSRAVRHYLEVRRSGRLAEVRRLDASLTQAPELRTYVAWQHRSDSATTAGRSLASFDREVRRASRIAQTSRLEGIPSPIAVRDGTLRVEEAVSGSLEVLLVPVGLVAMALQSHPIQVLAVADVLLNHGARVRAWVQRGRDPLSGITARQALEVLEQFPVRQAESSSQPDVEVSLPGGGRARGHKVTIYRENADGSWSITVIE